MTVRMTSPASMARKASLTSSSLIVRDTIDADVEAAGLDQIDEAREVAPHLAPSRTCSRDRLLVEEEPKAESVTVASKRVMPTMTTVPPRRAMLYACWIVSGRPMTSNA